MFRHSRSETKLQSEAIDAVKALGHDAKHYGTVSSVIRVLEREDESVPLSIRVKSKDFRWYVLGVMFFANWIIAIAGGVLWLVLLLLPSGSTPISTGARVAGFVGWLFMAGVFLAINVAAVLLSIGHNSAPNPGPAAFFYLFMLLQAVLIATIGIRMLMRRYRAASASRVAQATSPDTL